MLDLNVTTQYIGQNRVDYVGVAALPDGGAVVTQSQIQVYKIITVDQRGKILPTLFTTNSSDRPKQCILASDDTLFSLHDTGYIREIQLKSGRVLHTYRVPGVQQMGAGDFLGQGQFVVTDLVKKEIFLFDTLTGVRQTKLSLPFVTNNIVTMQGKNGRLFILCDKENNNVLVYDSSWKLERKIGESGTEDGQLKYPFSVTVSPFGTVWVADTNNNRVSEFTTRGRFVRHVVPKIERPLFMSFSFPYLWVTHQQQIRNNNGFKYKTAIERFKLFKE